MTSAIDKLKHFHSIFGNVVKDFYNNQEDENN